MDPISVEKRMFLAGRAIAAYNITPLEITFLQHSENLTFRVETSDKKYLLRLHTPVVETMGKEGIDISAIKSELLWLEAMRRETDLPLQTPVRNRRGYLVTPLELGNEESITCTLLEWLEGVPYDKESESEYTAAQLGMLVGKLHSFSSHWHLPAGFTRPKRDKTYFENCLQVLKPAVDDGRISYADFKKLELSVENLVETMQGLRKSRQIEGLLHGDLHRGNFIYNSGQIKLIDFSLCCFGNFMYDIAICMSDMKADYHHIFLTNYQVMFNLPANYQSLIEAYLLGSYVGTFAFWVNNPEAQETLIHRISYVAQEYAARFNRGEHFWLI